MLFFLNNKLTSTEYIDSANLKTFSRLKQISC